MENNEDYQSVEDILKKMSPRKEKCRAFYAADIATKAVSWDGSWII